MERGRDTTPSYFARWRTQFGSPSSLRAASERESTSPRLSQPAPTRCSRHRSFTTAMTRWMASRRTSRSGEFGCGDDRTEHRHHGRSRGAAAARQGIRVGRRRSHRATGGVLGCWTSGHRGSRRRIGTGLECRVDPRSRAARAVSRRGRHPRSRHRAPLARRRCDAADDRHRRDARILRRLAALDRIGADAQVGMALYTGKLSLGDAVSAPLTKPLPGDVWPTVVCDEAGRTLGLVWSTRESLARAVAERRGIYWSRSRQAIWEKGATSGNSQTLVRVDLDCDRDALRFTVRQVGAGFCHLNRRSCWPSEFDLADLERTLADRVIRPVTGSGTTRLLTDRALLAAKLREEADELARAESTGEVVREAADVVYMALVALARAGGTLADVRRGAEARVGRGGRHVAGVSGGPVERAAGGGRMFRARRGLSAALVSADDGGGRAGGGREGDLGCEPQAGSDDARRRGHRRRRRSARGGRGAGNCGAGFRRGARAPLGRGCGGRESLRHGGGTARRGGGVGRAAFGAV